MDKVFGIGMVQIMFKATNIQAWYKLRNFAKIKLTTTVLFLSGVTYAFPFKREGVLLKLNRQW